MRIRVDYSGTRDLESDLRKIGPDLYREGSKLVRDAAADGGKTARRIAKWTAGKHGKHYPNSITWDRSLGIGTAFGAMRASYGPDSSMPQGGMSFEEGSRNQPPHNDLANSLDLIRPKFNRDVDHMVDRLFWPES